MPDRLQVCRNHLMWCTIDSSLRSTLLVIEFHSIIPIWIIPISSKIGINGIDRSWSMLGHRVLGLGIEIMIRRILQVLIGGRQWTICFISCLIQMPSWGHIARMRIELSSRRSKVRICSRRNMSSWEVHISSWLCWVRS